MSIYKKTAKLLFMSGMSNSSGSFYLFIFLRYSGFATIFKMKIDIIVTKYKMFFRFAYTIESQWRIMTH